MMRKILTVLVAAVFIGGCYQKPDVLVGTGENAVMRMSLENVVFSNNRTRCFIRFDDSQRILIFTGYTKGTQEQRAEGILRVLELFEERYPELRIKDWKIEQGVKNITVRGLWLELEPKNISAAR